MITAEAYKNLIEKRLSELVAGEGLIKEAMRYSLMAGGKRIRPMLILEFARICGGDINKVLDAACSIEMIHTYSLIHDDLPCMDNDELRRGKPTNHVVFGECTATLAGDALQPLAFETIMNSELDDSAKVRCARILAHECGCEGMVLGQVLDMQGEGHALSVEQLNEINKNKCGALLAAACEMGVAAVCDDVQLMRSAYDIGYKFGLAFQIRDDMLDVLSTNEELGKPVGSDAEENKNTYMVLLGEKKCAEVVSALTEEALELLRNNFKDIAFLEEFISSLEKRKS